VGGTQPQELTFDGRVLDVERGPNAMADDPKKTAADRKCIDVNREHECKYWSEKFSVSPDELKATVGALGPMIDDVAKYPSKNAYNPKTMRMTAAGSA
jgi:hypothetical protein